MVKQESVMNAHKWNGVNKAVDLQKLLEIFIILFLFVVVLKLDSAIVLLSIPKFILQILVKPVFFTPVGEYTFQIDATSLERFDINKREDFFDFDCPFNQFGPKHLVLFLSEKHKVEGIE